MSGSLRYTLVVRHPETSAPTALLAGEPVPDWATSLVHADDLESEAAPAKKAASAPAKKSSSSNN